VWSPPPTVTEHNGDRLDPELEFFVAPPAEIGAVRSAHTSLKKGERARPTPIRAAVGLGVGAVGFLLSMGFHRMTGILFIPASVTGTPPALWAGIFGLLAAYLGWRGSGFAYECNFAGDSGCAQFRCEGDRATVVRSSVFLFKGASAVSTRLIRSVKNGQYFGTKYYFHWYSSPFEKSIYDISGIHHADSKTPPARDLYNFARAVESAWYDFVTPAINAEFTRQGFVKFYMGYNCWAAFGRGFIEITDKEGRVSRCAAEDIGSAKLRDGYLTIRRKDAKSSLFDLFNSQGVYGFDYAAIRNGRLFLYLFEKSLGIRVQ
jgi:hypothetical protein